jgi:uncharacterized protein (DUF2267 family)
MAIDLSGLDRLSPDARAKVEAALKKTLSAELAGATAGDPAQPRDAFSRSRGAFFSRSKASDAFRVQESEMINAVTVLDDAQFAKFAERLATLKNAAKGSVR